MKRPSWLVIAVLLAAGWVGVPMVLGLLSSIKSAKVPAHQRSKA